MMSTFLPYLKHHVRICNALHCLPFAWNPEQKELVPKTSKRELYLISASLNVNTVYAFLMGINVAMNTSPLLTLEKRFLGAFFCIMFFAAPALRVPSAGMVLFINSVIYFEEKLIGDGKFISVIYKKLINW